MAQVTTSDSSAESTDGERAMMDAQRKDLEAGVPAAETKEETDAGAEPPADGPETTTTTTHQGILAKISSRRSTKSWNPGPPPDGGLEAWVQVFCSHLIVMNTWGYINSFGVFQTYYATTLRHAPSDISWIGSIQVFLLFFIGTMTGRLTDAGYFRHLMLLGTAFQVVGIFTTSVATEYWQLFLAQGVCMGLGNGCLFCPSVAVLSTYFSKKRSLAIGIGACGSATGGLVFPSIVRQMLPRVGFGWTMRTIGFVQLATLIVANLGLRTRIPPRKAGPLVELSAFRDLEYLFYACGAFFCFWGIYFVFYYLASFSRDIIGMPYTDSLNLLLVLNGVGAVGRLLPNYFADRFGPVTIFIPIAAASGICVLSWIGVTSAPGLYAWTVFSGFAAAGVQSLFPAALSSLTTDLRKVGVRIGMVFTINSFATLTGPPIAGALISAAGGRFYGAQAFAGSVLLIGTGFLVAAKMAMARKAGHTGSFWTFRA